MIIGHTPPSPALTRSGASCDVRSVLITRGAFEEMYEPAWNRSLNELGVRSWIFDTHSLTLPGILGRVERRILQGPGVSRIRKTLINIVRRERPDVTLLYQGHYFDCQTLEEIRPLTFVAGYHNDDPFGKRKTFLRYRWLLPALPYYHGFHVYRACNLAEAIEHGAKRAGILMSYYLPWVDYPRLLSSKEKRRWGCDLVFAGHAERDERLDCLIRASRMGVRLRIYGGERQWKPILPPDVYAKVRPISHVTGDDYRKALCGAKIATCFFSRWNRDEYTRRSFEIPACGVFMLSERTSKMKELYEEGREAEFFSTTEEFADKVRFYLDHDDARKRIAEAGYRRVTSSGHDIYSRMRQWLFDVTRWREESGVI